MKQADRKVFFLVHPFDAYAGSQRIVKQILLALEDQGHRCRIHLGFGTSGFVSNLSKVGRFLPINNIRWRKRLYFLWIIVLLPRMFWAIFREEIVWANTVYAIPAVLPALLFAPQRVVVHLHEIEFPKLFYFLTKWAAKRGARVLCVSELHRKELRLEAEILYNCVDVINNSRETCNPPVLIFVGAISQLKGFDLFVDVVRALKPETIRTIAYVSSLPDNVHHLTAAAHEAGIEIKVGISDPTKIYPGATLLLQCTNQAIATETFSLVAAEAISFGVPVATAGLKVGGEILGEAWAFDVPNRNPSLIAEEIQALFADSNRLQTLRKEALVRSTFFKFPAFNKRVEELVKTI